MVMRNKAAFGLLLLAIVCGIVAGLGAAQASAQGFNVPNAICSNPSCNAVFWGNPPTDGAGNALPAGSTCTMGAQMMRICVATPGQNCAATAMIPNGCGGTYTIPGQQGLFGCFQAIYQC